jgi:hypothetical protein
VYLEGGSPGPGIARELNGMAIAPTFCVARGTIWPKPLIWHVAATPANLAALAGLFEKHVAPEICVHFHAYHAGRVLVQWYDAFFADPVLISAHLPEADARAFAERCSCECRRATPLCQKCGYDLTANVSGVCPECGTRISGKAPEQPGSPL